MSGRSLFVGCCKIFRKQQNYKKPLMHLIFDAIVLLLYASWTYIMVIYFWTPGLPKLRRLFWKFWKLTILCHFSTKNDLKMPKLRQFFVQKWHEIAILQNFQKNLLNFGPLYGVVILCKFQLIWTKFEGADTFGVKYLKISILSVFYMRSY